MYRVLYYSKFYRRWQAYVTPTHNAKPTKYETREQAAAAMAHLQRVHPRDQFMLEGDD